MRKKSVTPPDVYADRMAQLSPDESQQIRDMITSPLFVKYLRILACARPSTMAAGTIGNTVNEHTLIASTIKLSEIRGWELYQTALWSILNPIVKRTALVEPTYPDSARVET